MDMNERLARARGLEQNRTTSFRPSRRACLRACRKTTKNGFLTNNTHVRASALLKEKEKKNTPLCARSDPPPLPSPRSLRKQEPHVPRSSRNLRTHVHTHPHKRKTRARKTHAGSGIPATVSLQVEQLLRHFFLLYSTFCLALRRRGTISCA